MYTLVYQYVNGLGAALISGTMLFEGSQKMWFDFIPSIASFFGVVVEDIFFPIDKGEITRDIMGGDVDCVIAMENPPKEIRKIAYNMKGLSFKKGEYGMMRVRAGINDKISLKAGESKNPKFEYTMFSNMVDESPTMITLLKQMERLGMGDPYDVTNTTDWKDLKACVFSFENANIIVKETGGRLVMVTI
jgi:hypothetical protein